MWTLNEEKQIIVSMDVEDDVGQTFKAAVSISLGELRLALKKHQLDICELNDE